MVIEVNRRSVAIGHHDLAVFLRLRHGGRGGQGYALLGPVEGADRGIGIGLGNNVAHIFQRDVAGGCGHGIDLHPHGKFLRAIDQHLRDAGHLRNLRREHRLGVIIDRRERHRV